ncbi:MAG: tRNA pseudouridine(38-40) synthase TruA [Anaerolineae bacterium]|nr:tRNA pseudouridine(38-40) synthase TruA [Anaerolineae bacterium]
MAGTDGERHFFCATVSYDGTDFNGYQIQVGQRTVQGTIEAALAQITQEQVRVTAAGRTDSGVHALGQVIAFRTGWKHPIEALHRGLNALLPSDVAILALSEAKSGFHPRFDAQSRVYRYTIWNDSTRNPLVRRYAHWVSQPLNIEAMIQAAQHLIGEHDFATFGQSPQGTQTVRRVMQAVWTQNVHTLCFKIEANAFLYRMVRSIVGTLLKVGMGEWSVDDFTARFTAADRSLSGPAAPAHGLCLLAVNYRD